MPTQRKSPTQQERISTRLRRDAEAMLEAAQPLRDSVEFSAAFAAAVAGAFQPDPDTYRRALEELVRVVKVGAPAFVRFADEGLPSVLHGLVAHEVLRRQGFDPAASRAKAAAAATSGWIAPRGMAFRISTDNPIIVRGNTDGSVAFARSSDPRHRQEVVDFLAELLPRARPGRPRGSRLYSRDEFVAKLRSEYARLVRAGGRPPTREQVAKRMGIDRSALRRNMLDYGVEWPPK